MICNGDIATQVDAGPATGVVKAIEPYEDDPGRMRLRLLWDTNGGSVARVMTRAATNESRDRLT